MASRKRTCIECRKVFGPKDGDQECPICGGTLTEVVTPPKKAGGRKKK